MSNFSDVLGNLEGGVLFLQVNDKLAELVQAVTHHRKAGEISITLKAKVPEGARGVTVFFADAAGTLLRRNPEQPELPLREVTEQRQPLRTA